MSAWYTQLRLQRALIDMKEMRGQLPRLARLINYLDRNDAWGAKNELLGVYNTLAKCLASAATSLESEQNKAYQLMWGIPAGRTTPLIIATEDDVQSS